ncbi:ATP-dependent Clp protease proteolytic subunit [Candidatus Saccharibacteria bacterium]|nr:ATP-dependent Clp protease proteolytic subunit [Candidatus Saccharibacteria bacterium]
MKKKLLRKDIEPVFDDELKTLSDDASLTLNDLLYLRNFKNRELWLDGEIDETTVADILVDIREYNRQDHLVPLSERVPIKLFIDSPGGDVVAGLAIIDTIYVSKTPVYTVNVSKAYSMAFQIMISGHKRFAFKSSSFLLHDGAEGGFDSSSKFRDRLKFSDDLEKLEIENIVKKTKITNKEYEKNVRREWYMLVPEALELGVIDEIVESFDQVCSFSEAHKSKLEDVFK